MEMNTRLQVEHGVTEEIFAIDLVEWQLRIAAGERLAFTQDELVPRGHAIEARICAEDPLQDFAPSAGRLEYVRWPADAPGVRVEAGFETGDEVSSHYDSLIAKLIGTGSTRAQAIAALLRGLRSSRIVGVATNTAWLAAALSLPALRDGAPDTRFAAQHGSRLATLETPEAEEMAAAALVFIEETGAAGPRSWSPWDARDGFRINLPAVQTVLLRAGGVTHPVEVTREGKLWRVRARGADLLGEVAAEDDRLDVRFGGVRRGLAWYRDADRLFLWRGAVRLDFQRLDLRRTDVRASAHEGDLIARLPGVVAAVAVAAGDRVEAGAVLLVVEAMKMEHAVRAPRAGIVKKLRYARGDRVDEGDVLVELDDAAVAPGATEAPNAV